MSAVVKWSIRPGLNFEATPVLNLLVTVSDGVQTSLPQSVLINLVNVNESPSLNSGTVSIAENLPIGSTIATLTATDPDVGDTTELNPSFSPFVLELFAIERGEVQFQLQSSRTETGTNAVSPETLEDFIRDPYNVSAAIIGSGAIW